MTQGDHTPDKPRLGLWGLIVSVLAAAVGVQNKKNLEKDFGQSSPLPFILAGIIFTVLFLGTLIAVVSWVLKT